MFAPQRMTARREFSAAAKCHPSSRSKGETREIRSRRVLSSRPGAEPSGSDVQGRKAPIVLGKGATNEAAQGSANVGGQLSGGQRAVERVKGDPPLPSVPLQPQFGARNPYSHGSSVGGPGWRRRSALKPRRLWDGPERSCKRAAEARRRAPCWIRVATRDTSEAGTASEERSRPGWLYCLPGMQRRRVSFSSQRACRRPQRDGTASTSEGGVKRSVQDRTSR